MSEYSCESYQLLLCHLNTTFTSGLQVLERAWFKKMTHAAVLIDKYIIYYQGYLSQYLTYRDYIIISWYQADNCSKRNPLDCPDETISQSRPNKSQTLWCFLKAARHSPNRPHSSQPSPTLRSWNFLLMPQCKHPLSYSKPTLKMSMSRQKKWKILK